MNIQSFVITRSIVFTLFLFFAFSGFSLANEKIVYVSINGSDQNDGSFNSPFRTIQKASMEMGEGGTCYILKGTYRETVTVVYKNQTFMNHKNDYVIVTGLDTLSQWTEYMNGIYKTSYIGTFQTQFTQLFMNGLYQQMARWPNNTSGKMMDVKLKSGYAICEAFNAVGTESTRKVTFEGMPTVGDDFWKGGYFRGITGYKWMNPHGIISRSSGKDLIVNPGLKQWQTNSDQVKGGGHGYIFHLNALDMPGEWHAQQGQIYFMPPAGRHPDELSMEFQRRKWAFRINGRNGVSLKGLHIKAASLEMKASDCVIDSCTFRYIYPYFTRKSYNAVFTELGGIYINGNNNLFTKCYVAGSWGNGFSLENGDGNKFENNIIEDIGWDAQFTSSILTHAKNTSIKRNTFGSTGRFHIRFKNKTDIIHNDLYDCMKMGQDAGSIEATSGGAYATPVDIDGSQIAYNYIHDSNALPKDNGKKQFVVALYIEDVANYTAHHNVIWNFKTDVDQDGAFVYLGPRRTKIYNVNYYNNTVWNCDKGIGIWNRDKMGDIEDTRFWNNVLDSRMVDGFGNPSLEDKIDFSNNVKLPLGSLLFKDEAKSDFTLSSGSKAIDKGREIPGITDGFTGSAPDAGAYEYGTPVWTVGANIMIPEWQEIKPLISDAISENAIPKLLIYPNPVNGGMLCIVNPTNSHVLISIRDLNGKSVFNSAMTGRSFVLPVQNHLSKGIYLITLQNRQYKKSQKLIIN